MTIYALPPTFASLIHRLEVPAPEDNNPDRKIEQKIRYAAPSMYTDPNQLKNRHVYGGFAAALIGTAFVALVILTALTINGVISPSLLTHMIGAAFSAGTGGIAALFITMIATGMVGFYVMYKGVSYVKEAYTYDLVASAKTTSDFMHSTPLTSAVEIIGRLDYGASRHGIQYPRGYEDVRDDYISATFTILAQQGTPLNEAQIKHFAENLFARDPVAASRQKDPSCCLLRLIRC